VAYCVEPQQNIALARNTAIRHADGDMIAFIDDDEFPEADWLQQSFKALETYQAAGILGPVVPHFAPDAPQWIKKGRYFDRPRPSTGYEIPYGEARTGNLLFRKNILDGIDSPFNPEFGTGGEDVDFFRRMTERGCKFFWCDEAIAYEVVPPSRCKLSYLLKRALLRGSNAAKHPTHRIRNAAKSLIAVPCYTLILPILALLERRLFVDYLIKICDHGARLLAFLGLRLATHREM
jgi:GT2 family glycosyltransferase